MGAVSRPPGEVIEELYAPYHVVPAEPGFYVSILLGLVSWARSYGTRVTQFGNPSIDIDNFVEHQLRLGV